MQNDRDIQKTIKEKLHPKYKRHPNKKRQKTIKIQISLQKISVVYIYDSVFMSYKKLVSIIRDWK